MWGLIVRFCTLNGVYEICALVNRFLRSGNFLNPTNGLFLKVFTQSLLCSIMFQFEWMNCLISGLLGLNLVTITGVLVFGFCFTVNNSSCVNLAALSMRFFRACNG